MRDEGNFFFAALPRLQNDTPHHQLLNRAA